MIANSLTRSMRYQKSAYLGKYRKQMQNGEKCTKSKTTAHTDSRIRTECRPKRQPGTWKIPCPLPPFLEEVPKSPWRYLAWPALNVLINDWAWYFEILHSFIVKSTNFRKWNEFLDNAVLKFRHLHLVRKFIISIVCSTIAENTDHLVSINSAL